MYPYHAAPVRQFAQPAPAGHRPPHAWRMLQDAIEHGSEQELARLVDLAVLAGAAFTQAQSYDEQVLVMATRANRPWAIAVLMSRGATLPDVPRHGVDLLMEACSAGHAAMAEALIVDAGIGVLHADGTGKTALHCAVIANSPDIVRLLLKHGANVEACATEMEAAELRSVFGPEQELEGQPVTPLMIAAASGNSEIVQALVDAGADLEAGGCAPVIVAARHGHPAIISLLLSEGAELRLCTDESNRGALASVLHFRSRLDCLRLLAPLHDYSGDDGTIDSPLGIAVEFGEADDVALLLECGAKIELNSTEYESLWDIALLSEQNEGDELLIDLMASKVNCPIPAQDLVKFSALLGWLIRSSEDPAELAAAGMFPSLLNKVYPTLMTLRIDGSTTTPQQASLQLAFAMLQSLPALPAPPGSTDADTPPDVRWKQQTARNRHAQRQALHAGSAAFVAHCLGKLRQVVTADFFFECHLACPPDEDLARFMKNKLAEAYGMPDEISKLVSKQWVEAARRGQEWQVAPNTQADANQFLVNLARNLMRKVLENFNAGDEPLLQQCAVALADALSQQPAPLTQFCADPVRWLRRFENRNHLQPIHVDEFAGTLQVALGLPMAACTAIADAWQQALHNARNSRQWRNPAELQTLLAQELAVLIDTALDDGSSMAIVMPNDRQALLQWAATAAGVVPAAVAAAAPAPAPIPAPAPAPAPAAAATTTADARPGKRPASGEPDGAPPNKEARL